MTVKRTAREEEVAAAQASELFTFVLIVCFGTPKNIVLVLAKRRAPSENYFAKLRVPGNNSDE